MKSRGSRRLYVIVWRYRVRRGAERRFEGLYGPRGVWARFFAKGRGYLGTQLYRDAAAARSYITLDLWRSRADFLTFHRRHHAAYQRIDRQCELLTAHEERIGGWTVNAGARD